MVAAANDDIFIFGGFTQASYQQAYNGVLVRRAAVLSPDCFPVRFMVV